MLPCSSSSISSILQCLCCAQHLSLLLWTSWVAPHTWHLGSNVASIPCHEHCRCHLGLMHVTSITYVTFVTSALHTSLSLVHSTLASCMSPPSCIVDIMHGVSVLHTALWYHMCYLYLHWSSGSCTGHLSLHKSSWSHTSHLSFSLPLDS